MFVIFINLRYENGNRAEANKQVHSTLRSI
jgi:hypothetical protein